MQLNSLNEMRKSTLHHTKIVQNQRVKWHDRYIEENKFEPSDCALLYESEYQDNARKL